jgi:hypothetical protein
MQTTTINPIVDYNNSKGIGRRQAECLRYIAKHGLGGTWGKPAESRHMIDSLVRRGLITVPEGDNCFRLTAKGESAVRGLEGKSFVVRKSAEA